jgi:hypothetical protein
LSSGLPFEDYDNDEKKLRERLEKEYDAREKVIGRIMELANVSEKTLRMYTIRDLQKWEKAPEKRHKPIQPVYVEH